MPRLRWNEEPAPARIQTSTSPLKMAQDRSTIQMYRDDLEKIAGERRELALDLWREVIRHSSVKKKQTAMILLGAVILLASDLLFAGILYAIASHANPWALFVFTTAAALILAASIVLSVIAIIFLEPVHNNLSPSPESLFFNPESGAAVYPNSTDFLKGFQQASRERLASNALEELYWLGHAERRRQYFARWASILLLIGLIPFLLVIITLAISIL